MIAAILSILGAVLGGLFVLAFIVAVLDLLFEANITRRLIAPLKAAGERRRQRKARAAERRRVAALSPIEAMVEYKKQRRVEESQQWMTRLREVMPAPNRYDYEEQRRQSDLFSGNRSRIGDALTPPGGTVKYQREKGEGYDDLVVVAMDGTEILRIPPRDPHAGHRP